VKAFSLSLSNLSFFFHFQHGLAIGSSLSEPNTAFVQAIHLKNTPDLIRSKHTNGLTPLHFAAVNGFKDVVALLLVSKAEANAKNNDGRTPLQLAVGTDLAALLLASKAKVLVWTRRWAIRGRSCIRRILNSSRLKLESQSKYRAFVCTC
jgi:ankyrin repeat protein